MRGRKGRTSTAPVAFVKRNKEVTMERSPAGVSGSNTRTRRHGVAYFQGRDDSDRLGEAGDERRREEQPCGLTGLGCVGQLTKGEGVGQVVADEPHGDVAYTCC